MKKQKLIDRINSIQETVINDTTGEFSEREKKLAQKAKDANFTQEDVDNLKKFFKSLLFFILGIILGCIINKFLF